MSEHCAIRSSESDEVPAGAVLSRLASELRRIHQLGGRIEPTIADLASRPGVDVGERQQLQQIDLLLQHIDALQTYVAGLSAVARDAGPLAIESALSRVLLGDVRERLAGKSDNQTSENEVELF